MFELRLLENLNETPWDPLLSIHPFDIVYKHEDCVEDTVFKFFSLYAIHNSSDGGRHSPQWYNAVLIFRDADPNTQLPHLYVKVLNKAEGETEADNVTRLYTALDEDLYGEFKCVRAEVAHTPTDTLPFYVIITPDAGTTIYQYNFKDTQEIFSVVYTIAHALFELMKKTNMCYLDIKPMNFCIDEEKNVSIIDYGSFAPLNSRIGTMTYPHPSFPFGVDVKAQPVVMVYGIGVLLVLLLHRHKHGTHSSPTERGFRFHKAKKFDSIDEAREYLQQCRQALLAHSNAILKSVDQLEDDALQKINIRNLLVDSIINQINFNDLLKQLKDYFGTA
jgi:hypothetical protein